MLPGFKSRKDQINRSIFRRLKRALNATGLKLDRKQEAIIRDVLKDAAMVGGCELRQQALDMLPLNAGVEPYIVRNRICVRSVMEVLGYDVPAAK